jgi:hypothetical protein
MRQGEHKEYLSQHLTEFAKDDGIPESLRLPIEEITEYRKDQPGTLHGENEKFSVDLSFGESNDYRVIHIMEDHRTVDIKKEDDWRLLTAFKISDHQGNQIDLKPYFEGDELVRVVFNTKAPHVGKNHPILN